MLKENDSIFRNALILLDMALVVAAFFVSYHLCSLLPVLLGTELIGFLYPIRAYYKLLPLVAILWGGALYFFGGYEAVRGRSSFQILGTILKSGFAVTVFFGIIGFAFHFYFVSRVFMALIFFMAGLFILFERLAIVHLLRAIRRRGYNYKSLLIVGTGPRAISFMSLVYDHPEWGFRVAGFVDEDPKLVGTAVWGHKVLGSLEEMPRVLSEWIIDDVVFIVPRSWLAKIEKPILQCEEYGKRVSVALDHFNLKIAKAKQTDLDGFPLLTFQSTPDKVVQLFMKRAGDIVFSSLALCALSPFFLAVAAVIKVSSPGPVFFKQVRSGLNGRKFTLYKFRTMVPDAERQLAALRAHNEMDGPAFKMENDPRITPAGRFMRKFSIDELPQLINVLNGDMSLVGPRPPIPEEVSQYEPWQRRRLSMPPGITCIWQVSGRNNIADFDQWMKLDLNYIDKWSLWLDMKIMMKTVPVVLFGVGAK